MNAMAWMAQQDIRVEKRLPTESKHRPAGRFIRRTDGSTVPEAQHYAEIQRAVVNVLKRYGPKRIADVRSMLSQGFFVSADPRSQAAEISNSLKALRAAGEVIGDTPAPIVWRAI